MTEDSPKVEFSQNKSVLNTIGTDHITIWGSNEEDTVGFYRDVLGMPLVLRQPNLDDPNQTHLFFDTGDGTILTVFVSDNRESGDGTHRVGTGSVHHLCFSFEPERFKDVIQDLDEDGYQYSMFDRGIFQSIYTRDHNGLIIELTTDKLSYPKERKGEVLAETQKIREQAGAEYAQTEHMREALEHLGIEYTENDLPDATSGTAGL